jgi:hypothetical protein
VKGKNAACSGRLTSSFFAIFCGYSCLCLNLCVFASLADVAKGGDGAKSALREIFLIARSSSAPLTLATPAHILQVLTRRSRRLPLERRKNGAGTVPAGEYSINGFLSRGL